MRKVQRHIIRVVRVEYVWPGLMYLMLVQLSVIARARGALHISDLRKAVQYNLPRITKVAIVVRAAGSTRA